MGLFLLLILLSPVLTFYSDATHPSVSVHVALSSPVSISQFSPAITHVDNSFRKRLHSRFDSGILGFDK